MVLRCVVVDCGGVTHPDSGLKEVLGWDVHALLSCGNLSSCESRCIRIGIAHIFAYENDLGV